MTGYFDYLCREVGIGGPGGRPYRRLASFLLSIPFRSDIPGDRNREADACELRHGYSDAIRGEVRVLEILVSICQKLAYMGDGMVPNNEPEDWFFEMVENLGLGSLTDDFWGRSASDFEQIASEQVDIWLDRRYGYDGSGGLFPLDDPEDDQANVELWYQMNAYLMEKIRENE